MSDNQALNTFDGLDYEEIEQAVMETSRGRWFLTEFARRHKAADTAVLLDAIRRLEDQIQSMSAEASTSSVTHQLDGLEGLAELDEQPCGDSDEASGQPEIADKLDRTAKLVRRLRNSHKLISEAAEKPRPSPQPLSKVKTRIAAAGDPPGFVGSDDDIFADNKQLQSETGPQADAAPEVEEPTAEFENTPAFDGDTLKFAEIDMSELTARSDDDATVEGTPDQPELQAEAALSSQQVEEPASPAASDKPVSGRIDMNSPTAANQAHTDEEPAAVAEQPADQPAMETSSAAPDEGDAAAKPKKRIIVIRRPADHPGDIPLAGSDAEMTSDGVTAV